MHYGAPSRPGVLSHRMCSGGSQSARPEFQGLALHHSTLPDADLILRKLKVQLQTLIDYLAERNGLSSLGGQRSAPELWIKALFSGGPVPEDNGDRGHRWHTWTRHVSVDISSVVSRWVGETKNLREIFDAAEGGSAVILFDEADSLFGSRGDVKQAQDRFITKRSLFCFRDLRSLRSAILTTDKRTSMRPFCVALVR